MSPEQEDSNSNLQAGCITDELDNLFDIAHAKALQKIQIEEDRHFLLAQQEKGRCGTMEFQDIVLAKKDTRAELKQLAEKNMKLLSLMECKASNLKAVLSSNSSGSQVESTDSDD